MKASEVSKITASEFIETVLFEPPEDEIIPLVPIKETGVTWTEAWDGQRVERSKLCYYYAPYTLKPEAVEAAADGRPKVRRRAGDIARYYAIVLDDIGTKAEPPSVAPAYRLETSPGNEQWGYMIEPEADLARVNGFLVALKGAGLADDGALKLTQVFRLPGSWHYKHEFRARLTHWDPEPEVWTLEELGAELGIEWAPVDVNLSVGPVQRIEDFEDPVVGWLQGRGMVRHAGHEWLTIECPWADSHSKPDDPGQRVAYYSPLGVGSGDWVETRGFKCQHGHCAERRTGEFLAEVRRLGGPAVRGSGSAEIRGARDVVSFQQLYPPVALQDLPDLQTTADGDPKQYQLATTANLERVLDRMGVVPQMNMMAGEPELIPPECARAGYWEGLPQQGRINMGRLTYEDQCLRLGIRDLGRANDVATVMAMGNPYHPVEDWILSAPWDGQDRFEELFETITLTNPNDRDLARLYLRKWLIQVAEAIRGYDRQKQKEMILVFYGPQGCGKTTWISSLLPEGWVTTGATLSLGGGAGQERDSIRKATATPIVELGEIDATFKRTEISHVKSFTSQTVDTYRLSYGRTEIKRNRCTGYAGSVNHREFLVDTTGNRRYLVLDVVALNGFHSIELQQLWAQVSTWWEAGEEYHLDRETLAQQFEHNDRYRASNEPEDLFWSYFGGILSEEVQVETRPRIVTATDVATVLTCKRDKASLGELTRLLGQHFGSPKPRMQGVRKAWLIPLRVADSSVGVAPKLREA